MIIDAHTHLGFNDLVQASADQLMRSMKRAHIDKSCVFAGDLNACSTEKVIHETAPYRDRLYPIGTVSPFCKKYSIHQFDRWFREGKLHGLKCYPGYEFFYPFDKRLRGYFRLLSDYGKPVIFHTGDTYSVFKKAKLKYAHPLHIDELAAEMPNLKIVIAHLGYPWVVDAAQVCYKNKNVYADVSGYIIGKCTARDEKPFSEMIKTFVRIAGSDEKILFGTDWPLTDQKSYRTCVQKLIGKRHHTIFYKTAQTVFNL